MKNKKPEKFETVQQAADYCKVSWQSIYIAIKRGALKATKEGYKWKILLVDIEEYKRDRYKRDKWSVDGELVFDPSKGHLSIKQTAQMISKELHETYALQKVYYMAKKGYLQSMRKGAAWVIIKEDVINFINDQLLKKGILKKVKKA